MHPRGARPEEVQAVKQDYLATVYRILSIHLGTPPEQFAWQWRDTAGEFHRTDSLTPRPGKDVGYNGIEVAIDDTKEAGYVDTGALYDLVKPKRNAMKPVGEWNHVVITSAGSRI